MSIASGARVSLAYIAEVTRGTTPATPNLTLLRTTGFDVNHVKDLLESEEMRTDREISDVRHGMEKMEGTIPFELSLQAYDDLLEWAMGGTWAIATQVNTVQAIAATSKYVRATGSWITDGYRIGDIVTASGFTTAANNGQFRITVLTATDMTVVKAADGAAAALVDEAADVSQLLDRTKRLAIGTTLRTWTVERAFPDITKFQVFKGVACNTLQLTMRPTEICKGVASVLGMSAIALAGATIDTTGAYTDAPTYRPMASFQGVLYEGGTLLAVCTGVDLTLNNNRSLAGVIGSKFSPDVFEGRAVISGTATFFFQDAAAHDKFVNETTSSLWIKIADPDDTTKYLNIVLPKLLYTGAAINPPKDGPIPISMPFRALRDATAGYSMSIQRSNA